MLNYESVILEKFCAKQVEIIGKKLAKTIPDVSIFWIKVSANFSIFWRFFFNLREFQLKF